MPKSRKQASKPQSKKSKKQGQTVAEIGASDMEVMSTKSSQYESQSMTSESSDRLGDFAAEEMVNGDEPMSVTASVQEAAEDRLLEAIDLMSEKSANNRLKGINNFVTSSRERVLTSFLQNRHVTIADCLERCLKKRKGEEVPAAAKALSLLSINLGLTDEGEEVFSSIKPTLLQILQDQSASLRGRTACAETLGLCGFIAADDLEVVADIMSILESIFSRSYLKGDKTSPAFNPETYSLHVAALESWTLLLSISKADAIRSYIARQLPRLPELLESADLDIRIAGGEAIALMYELGRELVQGTSQEFEGPHMRSLCDKLKQLSTDNNKHQAKKDRKQQRSSFRDILRFIIEDSFKDIEYKFGAESVRIDTWAKKCQYDSFCAQLGSGTNIHLQENTLLRDIFSLGEPRPSDAPSHKLSRNERRLFNQAAFKARTQVRQKLRDKRTSQLSA